MPSTRRGRSGGLSESGALPDAGGPAPPPSEEAGRAAPDAAGHRQRLRLRFERHGGDGFADYEFLELFLFRSLPRRDTKPLAKELIRRFGSFAEVANAPAERLLEIDGVGPAVVHDFKLAVAAAQRLSRHRIQKRPVLSSWTDVVDHCRTMMAHVEREEFRLLFLDKKNHLIADELQQRGTVDHTPVYPREIVKRALELSATALILVHNHPSGDPTPSRADIAMTRQIVEVAQPLGIAVHDHLIIGRDGHASLRALGLL